MLDLKPEEINALKAEGKVDVSKKNVVREHSIQANDNATLIIGSSNNADTKAKLILKLEELKDSKQKWIDNEKKNYGILGSTPMVMRDIEKEANNRYDERIKSLEKCINNL